MPEPGAEHPLTEILLKLRYDLTAMQGKITEALNQAAKLDLPQAGEHRCRCGWKFRHQVELEEHAYHHHDGPLPASWAAADALAGDRAS